MATNAELNKRVSNLETKIDKIIDLFTGGENYQKVDEKTFSGDLPREVKTVYSGKPEPMNVDEALNPTKPEPRPLGKVPMDREGNITDPAWQRVKCDNGAEKYVKYKVEGINKDGSFNFSDEIEDETDAFYVDKHREEMDKWRKSNPLYKKMLALQK